MRSTATANLRAEGQPMDCLLRVVRDQSARSGRLLDVRFQPNAGYIPRGNEMT